jgi:hypothetical protein
MSKTPELVKINDHEYRCSNCREFRVLIPQDIQPDEAWVRACFNGHVERHHFTGELPPDPISRRKLVKGTRSYVLRSYVMSAIADDYESLQIVVDSVARWVKKDGVQAFHREELVAELGALIRDEYAQAYVLSANPPYASIAEHRESDADKFWFWFTPAGAHALERLD